MMNFCCAVLYAVHGDMWRRSDKARCRLYEKARYHPSGSQRGELSTRWQARNRAAVWETSLSAALVHDRLVSGKSL